MRITLTFNEEELEATRSAWAGEAMRLVLAAQEGDPMHPGAARYFLTLFSLSRRSGVPAPPQVVADVDQVAARLRELETDDEVA